ncbi:hypothetical protein ACIGXM_14520 [Kitasatospora sp. NPDC052896]|uniref:hypothetical protein n=1 Tax=Kitasatospora sp. NPDC052896 TaxID=3364061 RepID=UPI0037C7ADFA
MTGNPASPCCICFQSRQLVKHPTIPRAWLDLCEGCLLTEALVILADPKAGRHLRAV